MRFFNRNNWNTDPNQRALRSIGGDLGHSSYLEALANSQKDAARRKAVHLGVIAGEIIEVDFETGQRRPHEAAHTHTPIESLFEHEVIVHPVDDHEIS